MYFNELTYLLLFCSFLTIQGDTSFHERIRIQQNEIYVKGRHEIKGFHQTVDTSRLREIQPSNCSTNVSEFCLKWGDQAQFKIIQRDDCEVYEYVSKHDEPLNVAFDISGLHLYGGVEHDFQRWPMEFDNYAEHPFVSSDKYTKGVLEPFWLTSTGAYVYVDEKTPLFITLNKINNTFALIAKRESPYIRKNSWTVLNYTVCELENVKEAQKHAIANFLGKPTGIPDKRMVQYPIWTTWAKYKSKIDQAIVMEFANGIKNHNFPNSQLEIDDSWDMCYGSMEVDKNRFPDMKGLVQNLKKLGFRVTLWVHPFINENCEPYFSQAKQAGYLVKNSAGETRVTWWNGEAGVLDFTNPEVEKWWFEKLKKIQNETGIDSFKFDAMESNFHPEMPIFARMDDNHPETNLRAYLNFTSKFGGMIEVRVARGSQRNANFVRMMDRETNWNKKLGIQTMIPTLLLMNILGYPFVIPDIIGGNLYDEDKVTEEMFIRWLQISVFMPVLQFSYPPWDYRDDVVKLTRKFIDLHANYSDKIIEAMIHARETGAPVNPPIWWIDPTDPIAQSIGCEFLLGEDILVAPIIEPGARKRNIYLPRGIWRDENLDTPPLHGPIWLIDYPATLQTLPYFTKLKNIDDDDGGNSTIRYKLFSNFTEICDTSSFSIIHFLYSFTLWAAVILLCIAVYYADKRYHFLKLCRLGNGLPSTAST